MTVAPAQVSEFWPELGRSDLNCCFGCSSPNFAPAFVRAPGDHGQTASFLATRTRITFKLPLP
eukprot:2138132-Rhodomonas_salina.1